MSDEIKIMFDVVRWATPIIAGVVGYVVNSQRLRIKELSEKRESDRKELEQKIESNEKELVAVFGEGIREERKFGTEIMQRHDRHIEEIFGKLKDICIDGERLKTELENCTKITDRIKFK